MMARSEKIFRILLLILAIWAIGSLVACAPQPPVTRIVEVPSSKPYRYITWSPDDTAETKKQVRAHNRAHQEVIKAEKQAKP